MSNKKFLPLLIFLSAILLSIGWYEFIYQPVRREILNMELETRRLREVEREIFQLKTRHENLSAFTEAKEYELDAARNFLPTTPAQDQFIDELYRAAEVCRAQLVSVQAGETLSAEKFQAQVVSVDLETDYISLLNFIREIIDGGRLVSLERFSLRGADDGIISCELDFKIFAEPIKNPAN